MQSDKGCNSGKHVMLLEPGRRALTPALGGGSTQASWNRDCEYPFDGKRKKGIFGGGKGMGNIREARKRITGTSLSKDNCSCGRE